MNTNYTSKSLNHLGLVSGMIDELEIVETLNNCLSIDGIERDISLGLLCKALILNGLGFNQRRLYMVSSFFSDKPIDLLLGKDVKLSQLNDTSLGRCLDAIYDYGCTALYSTVAAKICKNLSLKPKVIHMDSTDFHVDGTYNSRSLEVEDHVIHVCKGYSRDHRPDLNQVVLNLIVDNQAGIAVHMEPLGGNVSDKSAFSHTIKTYIDQLKNVHDINYVVMDSAGYTEKTIVECGNTTLWVSRVPETLKECKNVILANHTDWQDFGKGYKYIPLKSTYANVEQRWLLAFSPQAYERELITLKRSYEKDSKKEYQSFIQLCKEEFECKGDAQRAFDKFEKKCKTLIMSDLTMREKYIYAKPGRPKAGEEPTKTHYFIQAGVGCKVENFTSIAQTKGRFIIASNEMNDQKLSDLEIIQTYKGQSKVERGFRFLKDPQFMASTLFVKKPERIEALLFIMTLSLSVYAALEYKIRQSLKNKNTTIPNQIGKQINVPTARWVFACFTGIHYLFDGINYQTLNLKQIHLDILALFDGKYDKYYLIN
jgi:transposase